MTASVSLYPIFFFFFFQEKSLSNVRGRIVTVASHVQMNLHDINGHIPENENLNARYVRENL